jgi:hypothetical protein
MIVQSRRRFLACLTGIIAAPAVVKAESLMRIAALDPLEGFIEGISVTWRDAFLYGNAMLPKLIFRTSLPEAKWRMINSGSPEILRNEILNVPYRLLPAAALPHEGAEG